MRLFLKRAFGAVRWCVAFLLALFAAILAICTFGLLFAARKVLGVAAGGSLDLMVFGEPRFYRNNRM